MIDIETETINKSSIDEIARGYLLDASSNTYRCVYCGRSFDPGVIYPVGPALLTAERAVERHLESDHGGPFEALMSFGKASNGLSEIQETVIRAMYEKWSDRDTAHALGGKATSTVRNHRFQLQRRRREAKLLLALMSHVDSGKASEFVDFHPDIPNQDDRIVITTDEAEALATKYFDGPDRTRLLKFPKKQKEKLVVLKEIASRFEHDRDYTEVEVNHLIAPIHDDYVTIRRYLIDYRFLERTPGGLVYRRR